MTKREFLESLRLALGGRVTSAQLTENLEYYEDYINTETRKGREEGEVLSELGGQKWHLLCMKWSAHVSPVVGPGHQVLMVKRGVDFITAS